jgi:hypothetical protein
MSVAGRNGEVKLTVTAETKVFIDGDPGQASALKVGVKVQVRYTKTAAAPFVASRVLDEASIKIMAEERDGVEATIDAVGERAEGDTKIPTLSVTTAAKKKHILSVDTSADGATLMKAGQKAGLDGFKAGDRVMLSISRTTGEVMWLKAMADTPTYIAFLMGRNVRGKVAKVDSKTITLTVEGEKDPVVVGFMRTAVFVKTDAPVKANPFVVGDDVVVKYHEKAKGVIRASGVFAPGSWAAYAAAMTAGK